MTLYFCETTASERSSLLCRWAERLFAQGRKVLVLVDSTPGAHYIDQMLWTFSQSSFIPHGVVGNEAREAGGEPVLIVFEERAIEGFDALLCDCAASVEFMAGFETAVHFVVRDDEELRGRSRTLWQKARDAGLNTVHVPYGKRV